MRILEKGSAIAVYLLFVTIVPGCTAKKAAPTSGFLGDSSVYSAMKDHPTLAGVRVAHFDSPSTLKDSKFIVPPVKIYLNEEGRKRNISREELEDLAVFFHNKLYDTLKDRYELTNMPGPNVRILRLAITDADPNVPALNIPPGTVISGDALGGATVEMAVEDSVTGKLLIAASASKSGAEYTYTVGTTKWGHTVAILNDFANTIRARLDEISADDTQAKIN